MEIKNNNYKIGIVVGRFNRPVTEKMQQGAIDKLKELGVPDQDVTLVEVPGAFEIPLIVKEMFEMGLDGVVTVGAVIRGDTSHFDFVCNAAERGCSELALEYRRPVGFGVITTENSEQAYDRAGGKKGNKGAEAAEVVMEMLNIKEKLSTNS
ncbi:MAG: 6,7-dimethyl-8-ribityllumazine synthase [Bdellovibrionales bacterium]